VTVIKKERVGSGRLLYRNKNENENSNKVKYKSIRVSPQRKEIETRKNREWTTLNKGQWRGIKNIRINEGGNVVKRQDEYMANSHSFRKRTSVHKRVSMGEQMRLPQVHQRRWGGGHEARQKRLTIQKKTTETER